MQAKQYEYTTQEKRDNVRKDRAEKGRTDKDKKDVDSKPYESSKKRKREEEPSNSKYRRTRFTGNYSDEKVDIHLLPN